MRVPRHRGPFTTLALAVTSCVLTGLLVGCSDDRTDPAAAAPRTARRAVDVLRDWDRARSRAFADGDVAALRRLYVPGSAAGRADARLLRGYLRRGLRVEDLRVQLLAVDVLDRDPDRLRLRVTDRVARAVAVGERGRSVLPRDRATTRDVELRRDAGGTWQVVGVSPAGPPRPAAR